MTGEHKRPVLLQYTLLVLVLCGFIFLAFQLLEAWHILAICMQSARPVIQTVDYIFLAVYCVGVLVCLPLLERALARRQNARAMILFSLRVLAWQGLSAGLMACFCALVPLGTLRWPVIVLLPISIAALFLFRSTKA